LTKHREIFEKIIISFEKNDTKKQPPKKKTPGSGRGEAFARPLGEKCTTQPSFDHACV
jgi:hypothetical protein